MKEKNFLVHPKEKAKFSSFDTGYTGSFQNKEEAEEERQKGLAKLTKLQDILYASNQYSMLLIFQAMDAAGKDGTIKHVMSGVNPQGCQVSSFKVPSQEELAHDYLWRYKKAMPERGRIGIFNRSYYEEALVVRVHPELLVKQHISEKESRKKDFWVKRFKEINEYEKYLVSNDIVVMKFFLHISKDEQKKRLLERIETPEKNWKYSYQDIQERTYWEQYMKAYEAVLDNTSTSYAPWYVIPADNKWFCRISVLQLIVKKLKSLDLKYPELSAEHMESLQKAKLILEEEKD